MENEKDNSNLIDINSKVSDIVFIPDYVGQSINNNISFLNWKESMLKKYGSNAKLFKCLKDNIFYYTSFIECINYPIYQSICPKCKNEICFYCSRNIQDYFEETGTCCLGRKIKCIFYQDCYRYINPIYQEENINSFNEAFISFILPIINIFTYIEHIQGILYFKLATKESQQYIKVERYFQHLKYYSCIELINYFIGIILVIPLFIIHIYFIIFILLIIPRSYSTYIVI